VKAPEKITAYVSIMRAVRLKTAVQPSKKMSCRSLPVTQTVGRVMAQVVSRRPLTAEARVRDRVNPCGICGGQNGTGTGLSTSSLVFPLSMSFHSRSPNSYHLGYA
jgi:hypothetical protein